MSTHRRGPRPAGSDTREAILEAARTQFSENGYGRATMRGIASGAGVDPRLVTHYFGSKRELFMASIRLPVDPESFFAEVFPGGAERRSERVAWALVGSLEDPETRRTAMAIMRAAATEPEAAEIIRAVLAERVLQPLVAHLDADHAELRATLVASQFVGLAMARYVVALEPLASAPPDQIVRALAPVIDHLLAGDWTEGQD